MYLYLVNTQFVYIFVQIKERPKQMIKDKQKQKNHFAPVVQALSVHYGVTERFVYMSIESERSSDKAKKIQKHYRKIMRPVNNALEQLINRVATDA